MLAMFLLQLLVGDSKIQAYASKGRIRKPKQNASTNNPQCYQSRPDT